MTYRLKLTGANVYVDGSFRDLEVGIEDGRIAALGREIGTARRRMDFGDRLILPGIIDGHVHFREPGEVAKEGFESGSRAALRGGVTTVIDMPNNRPPPNTPDRFEEKKGLARDRSLVNVALYAGMPDQPSLIDPLIRAGAVGFKHYMAEETIDRSRVIDRLDECGALLTLHAEDPARLHSDPSPTTPEEYLDARPPEAEVEAVCSWLDHPPDRLHIAHVSVPESVTEAAGAATSEITPHHLLLSREDVDLRDFTPVTHPPIRDRKTVRELQTLFANGGIDILASDHAPHFREEKTTAEPTEGKPGIPGVETLLPLSLSFAESANVPLSLVIEMLTSRPANLFDLQERGQIKQGYWADLVVVDQHGSKTIRGNESFSRAKVTPFEGTEVSFWPEATFVNGTLRYREEELVERSPGTVLRPARAGAGG